MSYSEESFGGVMRSGECIEAACRLNSSVLRFVWCVCVCGVCVRPERINSTPRVEPVEAL